MKRHYNCTILTRFNGDYFVGVVATQQVKVSIIHIYVNNTSIVIFLFHENGDLMRLFGLYFLSFFKQSELTVNFNVRSSRM